MKREAVQSFLESNTRIIVATLEKDGRSQLTPVVATYMEGNLRFTTPRSTRKVRNLARDPRVTVTVLGKSFWEWLSVEGEAELLELPDSQQVMRAVYERIAGKPHPNWEEYDEAMRQQQRVVVNISLGRMYPLED